MGRVELNNLLIQRYMRSILKVDVYDMPVLMSVPQESLHECKHDEVSAGKGKPRGWGLPTVQIMFQGTWYRCNQLRLHLGDAACLFARCLRSSQHTSPPDKRIGNDLRIIASSTLLYFLEISDLVSDLSLMNQHHNMRTVTRISYCVHSTKITGGHCLSVSLAWPTYQSSGVWESGASAFRLRSHLHLKQSPCHYHLH